MLRMLKEENIPVDVVVGSLTKDSTQDVYFKLDIPMNIQSQDFKGNVSLVAEQS